MLKHALFGAVLLITAVNKVESAELTLRIVAPIDGVVVSVVPAGSKLKGSRMEAQLDYDAIACSRKVKECPKTAVAPPKTLVEVKSDVLDLQTIQENEKVRLAEARLEAFKAMVAVERKAIGDDQNAREGRERAARAGLHLADPGNIKINAEKAGEAKEYGEKAIQGQSQAQLDRLNFQFKDLDSRLAFANNELEIARLARDILKATSKLGKLTCPRDCTVKQVFVVTGQYVTKGDLLMNVTVSE